MASPLNIKQSVVIPAVVVALSAIAHSVVLWMPMPETRQTSPSTVAEPESEELSVVVLPRPEASTTAVPEPPAPSPSQSSSPLTAPPEPEAALLPTDVIPAPSPPPPAAAPVPPRPVPSESAPSEPTTDELPIAEGTPTPAFAPSPEIPGSEAVDGPLMGYSDRFPHFEGAVGGCFGLSECRQVREIGSYRHVARSLVAGLEDQGYLVKLRDDLEDTGRNVYELTPPGNASTRQFLIVFSHTDGSAIYVMSPDVITLDELMTLSVRGRGERSPV